MATWAAFDWTLRTLRSTASANERSSGVWYNLDSEASANVSYLTRRNLAHVSMDPIRGSVHSLFYSSDPALPVVARALRIEIRGLIPVILKLCTGKIANTDAGRATLSNTAGASRRQQE